MGRIMVPSNRQPNHYRDKKEEGRREQEEKDIDVMIGFAVTLRGFHNTLRNAGHNPVPLIASLDWIWMTLQAYYWPSSMQYGVKSQSTLIGKESQPRPYLLYMLSSEQQNVQMQAQALLLRSSPRSLNLFLNSKNTLKQQQAVPYLQNARAVRSYS
ncbi:hypothetical protein BC829DRAFT_417125 [Chytridium lagenaria]|nr:hypothetical protein BC829DRAFT_417125 [Chytridium lagenaria]